MSLTDQVLQRTLLRSGIRKEAVTDLTTRLSVSRVKDYGSATTAKTLVDVSEATLHKLTLGASLTITLPAPGAGKVIRVEVVQDGTGGRTPTFATPSGAIYWPGGAAPAPTTGANRRDLYTFVCVGGTNWNGSAVLDLR